MNQKSCDSTGTNCSKARGVININNKITNGIKNIIIERPNCIFELSESSFGFKFSKR